MVAENEARQFHRRIAHPIPVGSLVLSVPGVADSLIGDNGEEDGTLNESGPNAVGVVVSADFAVNDEGWSYHVEFPSVTPRPPGSDPDDQQYVHVTLDQLLDGLDDPNVFRLLWTPYSHEDHSTHSARFRAMKQAL